MRTTLGLVVASLCICCGAATLLYPQMVSQFQEDADTTPQQALRQVRIGGVFLFLFGLAVLYAVIHDNGQPVEFIGV